MEKIVKLTEQEFKNIIENTILNEQDNYNVFKDPKAIGLRDFLMEKGEEFALSEINLSKDNHLGLDVYKVGNKEFAVATDEEVNKVSLEMANSMIYDEPFIFNNDFIIQHSSPLKHKRATKKSNNEILDVLRKHQYEGGLEILDRIIDNFDQYVKDAIKLYGRGNYLFATDGEEYRSGDYFIYLIET